jgi:hypothetical protein
LHTYTAGRNGDRELRYAGTREWVFPLLGKRRMRDRVNLLSALELKRRPDCEPTLRALVTDDWSPETIHHVGWCDSCRAAGFALGAGAFAGGRAAPAPNRGKAALVAVIAAAVIAVPVVASQTVGNPFDGGGTAVRGGIAHAVHKPVVPRSHKPSTTPSTTGSPGAAGTTPGSNGSGSDDNGGATGSPGTTTPKPPTKIIPRPRSRPLGGLIPSHHARIVPQMRIRAELPHTT